MVYGCDGPWWRSRKGLPEFSGVKLAHDPAVCADYRDVHRVGILEQDRMLFEDAGVVGSGGNSGFQALNLAAQFGATRILLIGFDMHTGAGLHWYGRNAWHAANNPKDGLLMRWRDAFTTQAPLLTAMGIEVINASPDSAMRCFPYKPLEQAIEDWNL